MTRCGMLACPPQGERERDRESPSGLGMRAGKSFILTALGSPHPGPLPAGWSHPQEAPPYRDRPVTPTVSHPADAAGLQETQR